MPVVFNMTIGLALTDEATMTVVVGVLLRHSFTLPFVVDWVLFKDPNSADARILAITTRKEKSQDKSM